MKGLSELLIIVVTVIVILIAAFIMVSIFGKGTGDIDKTVASVRATGQCGFRCAALCSSAGWSGKTDATKINPPGWSAETVEIANEQVSCTRFVPTCSCGSEPLPAK